MKGCLLLWLSGVKFSKAFESSIDGTAIAQTAQADGIKDDGFEQLVKVSHEPIDDESVDLKIHRSSFGSPSKSLTAKGEEAKSRHDNQKVGARSKKGRLSKKRRVQINKNMKMHKEEFASLKAQGEPLRKSFDVLMKNDAMLEKYGQVDGKKSMSVILKQLKEIHHDINELIQVWFRNWAGLGGWVLEPAETKEIHGLSREDIHVSSYLFHKSSKRQKNQQPDSGSLPRSGTHEIAGKCKRVKDRASQTNVSNFTHNDREVEAREKSQPQLNDSDLEKVYKKAVEGRVHELDEILHSIKFPGHFRMDWGVDTEKTRAIKLCFETYIFRAIGFMYTNGLIVEEKFKSFFSTSRTLEIIGMHLVDLYHVAKYGLYHSNCFIPDIEFLSNHWKTNHLHEILKGLSISQQAHVLGTSLIYEIKVFRKSTIVDGETLTSGYSSIINRKNIKTLLSNLENFLPKESFSLEYDSITAGTSVDQGVLEIISFFQESVNWGDYRRSLPNLMMIEFGLVYHVLSFIKTYYESYLGSIFENKTLEKQLELFEEGIKLQQIIKQLKIYSSIILGLETQSSPISRDFAVLERDRCIEKYAVISNNYKNLVTNFGEEAKSNPTVQNWIQGNIVSRDILVGFNRISGSWEEGLKIESERRKDLKKLHHAFKKKFISTDIMDPDILSIIDPSDSYI